MNRTLARVIAAALVVAAIAIAIVARGSHANSHAADLAAMRGTPLVPPKIARDFTLRNGDGVATHLVDRAYPATWLFFGYTHCPDACPLALASLGRAYRTLDAPRAARTRIVFVTVDPERDTSAVVRAYARKFDPHIVALTASRAELARVWDAYGIRVDATTHEIGHGDAIYAIDADGRVVTIYPAQAPVADLAADMRVLSH